MVSSIANSLGFGSGLDVKQLVTDLPNASREPKIARVTERTQNNETRVSALARGREDLEGLAESPGRKVTDGTLRGKPTDIGRAAGWGSGGRGGERRGEA